MDDIKAAKTRLRRKRKPILIIIDYASFLEDSLEFVSFIKRRYPQIATVVVTGHHRADDVAYSAKVLKSDGVIKGLILDVDRVSNVVDSAISNVLGF